MASIRRQGSSPTTATATANPDLYLNNLLDMVYCINLPQCTERRASTEAALCCVGLRYEFLEGETPNGELFCRWQGGPLITQGTALRCPCLKTPCAHRPRILRDNEIAISLSHRAAYIQVLERRHRLAMICEDDIVFHRDLDALLQRVLEPVRAELYSSTPIIVFLGGRTNPSLTHRDPAMFKLLPSPGGIYSNYCYIVNHAACEVLIRYFFPINRPEDSYKMFLIGKGLLQAYVITPSVVGEQSAGINVPARFKRLSTIVRSQR